MKFKTKKITAIILAAALTITALPVAVFADPVGEPVGEPENIGSVTGNAIPKEEVIDRYGMLLEKYDKLLEKIDELLAKWKEETLPAYQEKAVEIIDAMIERIEGKQEDLVDFEEESTAKLDFVIDKLNDYIEQIQELKEAFVAEDATMEDEFDNLIRATELLKAIAMDLKQAKEDFEIYAELVKADIQGKVSGVVEAINSNVKAFVKKVLLNVLDCLREKVEEWGSVSGNAQSDDPDDSISTPSQGRIEQADSMIEKALENLKGIIAFRLLYNELQGFINNAKDKIQEWNYNEGFDGDSIKELFSQAINLRDLLNFFEVMKENIPSETGMPKIDIPKIEIPEELQQKLQPLIEQAIKLFKDYGAIIGGSIQEAMKTAANQLVDRTLEEMGTSREEIQAKLDSLKDFVKDLVSYGIGYAMGESYSDLSQRTYEAELIAENLKIENENLTAALKEATSKSQKETTLENVVKVLDGAPALTSVKTKAGKKITIKWKAIKGAKIDFYQVKIGKKTVKVSAKTLSLTQKNKTVKKIMKKLKRGAKVKVTVRAAFKAGSKVYYSRWSKAKKAVVK